MGRRHPGFTLPRTDCQLQIKGYEAAKYKSFDTREEAERALTMSPYAYIGKMQSLNQEVPNLRQILPFLRDRQ